MKLHQHFKLLYVRNLGMKYPRPRMRAKSGFSCLKRVKRLQVYDRMSVDMLVIMSGCVFSNP